MLRLIAAEDANRDAFDAACELIDTLLNTRKHQMSAPRLTFDLFDQLRNNAPRQLRLAQIEQQQQHDQRTQDAAPDFLAPYLVQPQLPGGGGGGCNVRAPPTHDQSVAIMEACLADMRTDCLAVLNEQQRRYDEHVSEAKHFRRFLQKFHDQFDDTDYERLVADGEQIELNKRMTQQRLMTARASSQAKYDLMKRCVLRDERLGFRDSYREEELRNCGGDCGNVE